MGDLTALRQEANCGACEARDSRMCLSHGLYTPGSVVSITSTGISPNVDHPVGAICGVRTTSPDATV
jgi:hypothetical protein